MPDPIKARKMEWIVITKDNAEEIFKQLEESGQNPVFFAISPDGYQALAYTIVDLRNLIDTQRHIILQYKEYYEPKKEEPAKAQEVVK